MSGCLAQQSGDQVALRHSGGAGNLASARWPSQLLRGRGGGHQLSDASVHPCAAHDRSAAPGTPAAHADPQALRQQLQPNGLPTSAAGLRRNTSKLRNVAAKLPKAALATLGPPVVHQLGFQPVSEHDAFRVNIAALEEARRIMDSVPGLRTAELLDGLDIGAGGVALLKLKGCIAEHLIGLANANAKAAEGGSGGGGGHSSGAPFGRDVAANAARSWHLSGSSSAAGPPWSAPQEPPWGVEEALRLIELLSVGLAEWHDGSTRWPQHVQVGHNSSGNMPHGQPLLELLQGGTQLLALPAWHVRHTVDVLAALATSAAARWPWWHRPSTADLFRPCLPAPAVVNACPALLTALSPGELPKRLYGLRQACSFDDTHLWLAVSSEPRLLLQETAVTVAQLQWWRTNGFAAEFHSGKIATRSDLLRLLIEAEGYVSEEGDVQ